MLTRLGDGPGLLVLDNLEAPWNADEVAVEEALARLADAPNIRIVASIRGTARPGRVDWLSLLTLEALPPEDARELFVRVAGREFADDADLDALVAAMDGLPLAIDLLARRAQGSRTLGSLRADFEKRKAKLFELGEGKERSLKASLQLSLDSPKMTGDGKRLFTLMGRLPAGVALADLNKLLKTGGQAAGRMLCQSGLTYEDGNRLRMLAPIREHAAQRPMQEVRAIVGHYLGLAKTEGGKVAEIGGAEAVARLAPEIVNLETMFNLAVRERQTRRAYDAFEGFTRLLRFTGIGSHRPLENLFDAAGQKLDPLGRADCQFHLAELELARSNYKQAVERFQTAMYLYSDEGNMPGKAACIRCLGQIALQRTQHDKAGDHFWVALGLYREVGAALGEANCLISLGQIARDRSKHEEAKQHLNAARRIYRWSYDKPGAVLGAANCIFMLGEIALGRSEHRAASRRFDVTIRVFKKIGHLIGEANCIWGLGEVARERAEYEAAEEHFATALALYRAAGDRSGEAMCLLGKGQVARALGRPDADALLRQSLAAFEAIERWEGRGKALLELAALAENGEAERAMLDEALDCHRRFGNPRWIGEAHCQLARISEGAEQDRHVAAAREGWSSIDRPDLVAALDDEFNLERSA